MRINMDAPRIKISSLVQVTERFPNETGLKKEMAPYFRAQQSLSGNKRGVSYHLCTRHR